MLYHIVIGFIIPWIFGLYLYKQHLKFMVLFFPIGSAISFLLNNFGSNFFWSFDPSFLNISLTAMPYELGIYPVTAVFFVVTIHYKKVNLKIVFLIFALGTTFFELISVIQDKVLYRNGWNVFWTFCSYLISYFWVFLYYRLVKKLKVI